MIQKKMPECWFFAKYGECTNVDCNFLHISPEEKIQTCPWYYRGFCKHGPKCRYKHTAAVICPSFLTGFCSSGLKCKFAHPSFDIPKEETIQKKKIVFPPTLPPPPIQIIPHHQQQLQQQLQQRNDLKPVQQQYRSIAEVLCFKCKQKGHYANKCTNKKVVTEEEQQRMMDQDL